MYRNRIHLPSESISLTRILIILLICLTVYANEQTKINSTWKAYDQKLRNNAPDLKVRSLLRDAKLAAVTPTNSGLRLIYALVDGN